ncbi:hypothetical protein JCM10449v2_006203 [Rhodotorula kratochvilovae]
MPAVTLPDALVRTVIQTCDGLPTERDKTLASFCRLAKRYRMEAELFLYGRVTLFGDLRTWAEGSLAFTLAFSPRLARVVQHLTLAVDETCENLERLVDQLSNVTEIVFFQMSDDYQTNVASLTRFFENHSQTLVRISVHNFYKHFLAHLYYHSSAYPRLTHLTLSDVPREGALPLPKLTSLNLLGMESYEVFEEFAKPLARKLTSLSLSMAYSGWTHNYDLGPFRRLERLEVKCSWVSLSHSASTAEEVETLLLSVAGLPRLSVLHIEGSLDITPYASAPRAGQPTIPSPSEARASFKAVLDAVPKQIQHLALTGSLFDVEDLAAQVVSPARPPPLRSLRLAGDLAERFRTLLRGRNIAEWKLAQRLEQLGVELTTMVDE